MNSLRFRVAVVLLAAIASVVCLATVAAVLVGRHNGDEGLARAVAAQVLFLGDQALSERDRTPLQASPLAGAARDDLAAKLRDALRRGGRDWAVAVTRPGTASASFASVEVAPSRWLTLPIPEFGPPAEAWYILGGWMLLILLGTAGVSLAVARRVTRPLLMLERATAGIGPSGELQPLPEDGPAELRATARALNRLSGKLRAAVESRMRLVAAAGHDLRTPLTRMRLRAEFMEDEAERGRWLANIGELERIAESAIALVREEVGERGREPIRLDALVTGIADDLAAMRLAVTVDETVPVTVAGAPLALTRALRNLIVNAATHGGGATIKVLRCEDSALLVVEDRGPGIPEAVIGRVFEPFFRVDEARRQTVPGAGLGLAIAREIIARAGGELVLENRTAGGLRQVVELPELPPDACPAGRCRGGGAAPDLLRLRKPGAGAG